MSIELNKTSIGCTIGYLIVKHRYYADDLILFSSSHKGLQILLNVCNKIGCALEIMMNESKTLYIVFKTMKATEWICQQYPLNSNAIQNCKTKYLGHIINESLEVDEDIQSHTR